MSESSTDGNKTQARMRKEVRGIVFAVVFVFALYLVVTQIDTWRYPHQREARVEDLAALTDAGATVPPRVPDEAHTIRMVWDDESGAALMRFEYPAELAESIESSLDKGRHPCPKLSQYWRHDITFWCADRTDLRRRCLDSQCVYFDPAARQGWVLVR